MDLEEPLVEAPSRKESLTRHLQAFHARFGNERGTRTFFAPGRVNLMGAHLDYNGGPVMPMAIDRGTFIAVRRRSDGKVRFRSTHDIAPDAKGLDLELGALPQRTSTWADYPLGVVHVLRE